ncbi:MAG TPA: hypothetical protein IAA26_13490 [Candidatus Blautia faecipullorum]|nr:hypothetical protein [Candidatus Blautia faecipullorum]
MVKKEWRKESIPCREVLEIALPMGVQAPFTIQLRIIAFCSGRKGAGVLERKQSNSPA